MCDLGITLQSTAMVMSGWSVHLVTLFSWASFTKQLTSTSCTYFRLQLTTTLLESAEGRRTAVEIISQSISTKVWEQVGIELATPGLAVHCITYCTTRPGKHEMVLFTFFILDTGKAGTLANSENPDEMVLLGKLFIRRCP